MYFCTSASTCALSNVLAHLCSTHTPAHVLVHLRTCAFPHLRTCGSTCTLTQVLAPSCYCKCICALTQVLVHLRTLTLTHLRMYLLIFVLAHLHTCALTYLRTCACTYVLALVHNYLRICANICTPQTFTHWVIVLLNRHIFVCQVEAHSVCPVNTLTGLSVGLMLYHCLWRRPNIKTTLG